MLWGLYRGFIQSVLNMGAGLISFVGAFKLFPKLSAVVSGNTDITRFISTYTDSQSLLGNLDLSSLAVDTLSEEAVASIVERASLPEPIGTLLSHNLAQKVFSPMGSLATNVGDYVNQTVVSVSINVLCFLVCFFGLFLILTLLINLIRAVFRYPVLKHFDALAGGVFGFLLGVLICFAVFTLMPLLESVIPLEEFRALADKSQLAQYFTNGSLIISIMNRRL